MTIWTYKNQEFTSDMIENAIGFVYIITNLSNNKKYIGKKLFRSKIKRGKKRIIKESDWKTYCGSNELLKEDIAINPDIKKEILHICYSKGELSYYEIKEQIEHNVLFSDNYYNSYIGCRIHKKHLTKTQQPLKLT